MGQKILATEQLRPLTGLRGVAAISVAMAHFRVQLPFDFQALFMWHNAAVDFFFVLSGFTLCYAYRVGSGAPLAFGKYLVARFARIYPLYLLSLIVVWFIYVSQVMDSVGYPGGQATLDFFAQALVINAWPILGNGVHWNSPAWSVSVEVFCYLAVFPLLFKLPLIRNPIAVAAISIGLMAASYYAFTRHFDSMLLNIAVYEAPKWQSYWVNAFRGLVGFMAGWVVYSSYVSNDWLARACQRSFDVLVAAFWLGVVGAHFNWWNMQAVLVLFPFLVLGATAETGILQRALSSRAAHFLGEISYSIYLVHIVLYVTFLLYVGPPDQWTFRTYAMLIGSTMVVSTALHYGYERPMRSLIRKIGKGNREPSLTVGRDAPTSA